MSLPHHLKFEVTMNNIILPVLCFYVVGPHRSLNGNGSTGFRFQLRRLLHALILAFGVFSPSDKNGSC